MNKNLAAWMCCIIMILGILNVSAPVVTSDAVDSEEVTSDPNLIAEYPLNITAWLPNWTHRIPIEINNTANPTTLTNYQILLTVDTLTLISEGNMQPDGDDIRFTDEDEITPIPFWIENGTGTWNTTIWVNIPIIPMLSIKNIYMYYGNNTVSSTSSGDDTFILYDHFDGTLLNTTKWVKNEYDARSTVTVSGGNLVIQNDHPGTGVNQCTGACIVSNNVVNTETTELVVEGRIMSDDWSDSAEGTKFGFTDSKTEFEPDYYGTPLHYASGALYYISTPRCRNVCMYDGSNTERTFYEQMDDYRNNWYRVTCKYDYVNRDIYGSWVGPTTIDLFTDGSVTNVISNHVFLSGSTGGFGGVDIIHYFDWVAVRKFSTIEPIIQIGEPQIQLDAGLVAYWSLNEGSGQYANDTSGNENHGVLGDSTNVDIHDPTWVNGINGKALEFDGSNDFVNIPDNIAPNQITLEAWVFPTAINPAGSNIINKEDGIGPPANWAWKMMLADSEGDPRAYFYVSNGAATQRVDSLSIINLNTWYYFVGTYNGTEQNIYVNGILEDSKPFSGDLNNAVIPTSIGNNEAMSIQWFDGIIDEVSIWNRALTPTDVQQHYQETLNAQLVAHWPFDEGSGQYANDTSGNNNHGTLGDSTGVDTHDPTWVDGLSGKALEFDGVDDYVEVPNKDMLNLTGNYTLETWIMANDLSAQYQTFIAKAGVGAPMENYWLASSFNRIFIQSDPNALAVWSNTTIETNKWYYVAATYDSNYLKLYINGILSNQTTTSGEPGTNIKSLLIGATHGDVGPTAWHYNGIIDEVSIWNRALTPSEIQQHFDSTLPVHNIDTDEYFNEIQAAIDDPDTLNGHTIEVSDGTYLENVVVNKSLNLVGEDRNTTIIDGGIIFKDNFNRATVGSDWAKTGVGTLSIVSDRLRVQDTGGYTQQVMGYTVYTPTPKFTIDSSNQNGAYIQFKYETNRVGAPHEPYSDMPVGIWDDTTIITQIAPSDVHWYILNSTGYVDLGNSPVPQANQEYTIKFWDIDFSDYTFRVSIDGIEYDNTGSKWTFGNNQNKITSFSARASENDPANTYIDDLVVYGNGINDVVHITSDWVNISGFTITNGANGIVLNGVSNVNVEDNIIIDVKQSDQSTTDYWIDIYASSVDTGVLTANGCICKPMNGFWRIISSTGSTLNESKSRVFYTLFYEAEASPNGVTGLTELRASESTDRNMKIRYNKYYISKDQSIYGNLAPYVRGDLDASDTFTCQVKFYWSQTTSSTGGWWVPVGTPIYGPTTSTIDENEFLTSTWRGGINSETWRSSSGASMPGVTNVDVLTIYPAARTLNVTHYNEEGCPYTFVDGSDFVISSIPTQDGCGIFLWNSSINSLTNNNVSNNGCGIYLSTSSNNNIYHNSIVNNSNQAYDDGINFWDNGYPSGGNYWGDYNGVDFFSGPNQTIPGSDGIGDTPYINIDGGALPNYTHRIPIEINNSGNPNNLTNYQILLTIGLDAKLIAPLEI